MNIELSPQQLAAVKADLVASGEVLDLAGHALTVLTLSLIHELESLHRSYCDPRNYTRNNSSGAGSAVFVLLHKANPAAAKSWANHHGQPAGWGAREATCFCAVDAARKHADRLTLEAIRDAEKEAAV